MRNNYYKELVYKYFEAETSSREERCLRRFLATTDDPFFDDAKAVIGYLTLEKKLHSSELRADRRRRYLLWVGVTVLAAAMSAIPFLRMDLCIQRADGVTITDEAIVMGDVDAVLGTFFCDANDIDMIMSDFLDR